ncbi:hypothetical protein ACQKK5_17235, partial [Brevibacillus panacihumi]|uniref:hypothetical protein n=1 Tax=Brevibacillus panacihumi TaxID=497735 RepID=UPI003D045248
DSAAPSESKLGAGYPHIQHFVLLFLYPLTKKSPRKGVSHHSEAPVFRCFFVLSESVTPTLLFCRDIEIESLHLIG